MLFFAFKPFVAVIGDIVESKKLSDRKTVQEKLISVLNAVNIEYSENVTSKFMVTLGDEFQGLLHNGVSAIEIVEKIEREMHPVKIRFGIGVGEITTDIDPELPLGADGPAYHNARKMINQLKEHERKKMESKPNIKIEIEGGTDISELINTIFALNTVIKAKWTARQRQIIDVYLQCAGTQSDVAQKLKINQSNVQKALSSSNFYAYQQAIRKVTKVLSDIRGEQNV